MGRDPTVRRRYGHLDVDEHARGIADDYVVVDHRPLGWGRLDKAGYLEQLNVINELSPDAISRIDHVPGLCERGSFVVTTTVGNPVSGRYEIPVASVAEYDASGRLAHSDYYSLDQLDEARERYPEVESRGSTPWISNAVTRQRARFVRAWRAHDWDAVAATFAGDHQMRDGRSLVPWTTAPGQS